MEDQPNWKISDFTFSDFYIHVKKDFEENWCEGMNLAEHPAERAREAYERSQAEHAAKVTARRSQIRLVVDNVYKDYRT